MSHVTLEQVSKHYPSGDGQITILENATLQIARGERLAVTGPSGSGKSTLLNLIGALDRPDSGIITVGGTDVHTLEGSALSAYRATSVGFVFQDHNLLPQLTALENILLPTLAAATAGADASERATRLLERVGLSNRADHFPARLSGGERQRVAIARALISGAGLLLCDEPTGSLDQATGDAIAELFGQLAREQQVTVVLVTHDLDLACRFDRRLNLQDGTLVEQ